MTNVVFLAHRNDTPTDMEEILSCKVCKNKTWLAIYHRDQTRPINTTTEAIAAGQKYLKENGK